MSEDRPNTLAPAHPSSEAKLFRFSERRLVLHAWAACGAILFGWLFWRDPQWPLWSRLLGWGASLVLLWSVPPLPPLRHWTRRIEIGGSGFAQRRLNLAFGLRQVRYRRREASLFTKAYLQQRQWWLSLRAFATAILFYGLFHGFGLLFSASEPLATLLSHRRPPLHPKFLENPTANFHLALQIGAAIFLIIYASACRFERYRIERPAGRLGSYLFYLFLEFARGILGDLTRGFLYFVASCMTLIILYLAAMEFGQWLYPWIERQLGRWLILLPRRPLMEVGWFFVLGVTRSAYDERRLLRDSVRRQFAFAASALERGRIPPEARHLQALRRLQKRRTPAVTKTAGAKTSGAE